MSWACGDGNRSARHVGGLAQLEPAAPAGRLQGTADKWVTPWKLTHSVC
jgi:hypothetical protein